MVGLSLSPASSVPPHHSGLTALPSASDSGCSSTESDPGTAKASAPLAVPLLAKHQLWRFVEAVHATPTPSSALPRWMHRHAQTWMQYAEGKCVWCGGSETVQLAMLMPACLGGLASADNVGPVCGPCHTRHAAADPMLFWSDDDPRLPHLQDIRLRALAVSENHDVRGKANRNQSGRRAALEARWAHPRVGLFVSASEVGGQQPFLLAMPRLHTPAEAAGVMRWRLGQLGPLRAMDSRSMYIWAMRSDDAQRVVGRLIEEDVWVREVRSN